MLTIQVLTFNPFSENTYVLSDETNECVVIDPGCYEASEKEELSEYIHFKGLKPVKILLTHAHIDHVLGNNYLAGKYGIPIIMNETEVDLLKSAPTYGQMWGIQCEPSPEPNDFITDLSICSFGNTILKVLLAPGHSPGSLCYYHHESKSLIAGDVLFNGSIGRTDLPGGSFPLLEKSIKEELSVSDDAVIV